MAQTKDQKGSAAKPDDLTKISKHSVELTETNLKDVTGGSSGWGKTPTGSPTIMDKTAS